MKNGERYRHSGSMVISYKSPLSTLRVLSVLGVSESQTGAGYSMTPLVLQVQLSTTVLNSVAVRYRQFLERIISKSTVRTP